MLTALDLVTTVLKWVTDVRTVWKSRADEDKQSRTEIRAVLSSIMTVSLETKGYLLKALADPSIQNQKEEWKIITQWHNVGLNIYAIDEKDVELKSLARDITAWADAWASTAVWKAEQNQQSLLRCAQLSSQAEALLGEI